MFIIYLYLYGIIGVCYLKGGLLDTKLYENDFLMIDYWFLVHTFNNICIAKFYPKKLNKFQFILIPFFWEIIENYIVPNIGCDGFKEEWKDTFGDILSIIPGYLMI
tara:strand:- start:1376 stop:1693 length:318 start_codon:yes stop_codon:yes gene_type:complete